MKPVPVRDCPVVIDGYMAEIKGYGRLCGSSRIDDLVHMAGTFGFRPGDSRVRYYRHVRWADGREWTGRVDPLERAGARMLRAVS